MYNSAAMKVVSFIFLLAVPLAAQEYRASVSRIDITPPVGHAMGGYTARKGNATGTHDPLYATVLVLESGSTRLALVTADLRSFVSTRVGQLAKERFGVQHTIISVSHTHSGPLTWEARTPWYTEAEDKMVAAIGTAVKSLAPATIGAATGHVYLGFNRRKVTNGVATMWWRNEEKLPSHPLDPEVMVLTVRDASGATRAVLVNYACHPSILGPDNLEYSADYPGALKRAVEAQMPGALCLFVQGGAGDTNPYRDKEPAPGGFAAVKESGEALAKVVLEVARRAKPITGALQVQSEITEVRNRWTPADKIPIGLTTGMLGNGALCFLALPGEPFVEHQLTFREKSECRTAMLFGYSYSAGGVWAGYIPTIQAAAEGGYGASYNTNVAVGTGEMLVDRGVIRLFEMRGLLKELPDAW
jgi:neutral ceramidase